MRERTKQAMRLMIRVLLAAAALASSHALGDGFFLPTGTLHDGRLYPTATLLHSGKILVVGGQAAAVLASAELYDPATGRWTAAHALGSPRTRHTATLLQSGKVLVCGGYDGANWLASCTRYDPATDSWSAAGSLTVARGIHTATLLASGKVLVAGGYDGTGYLTDVRLYDPAANSWSAAAALSLQRSSHVAVALPSGKVLVAGGYGDDGFGQLGQQAASETYDPAANDWLPAGSLNTPRLGATATLLRNGSVILAGGVGVPSTAGVENTGYVFATEMYDPTLDQWTVVGPLHHARASHSATLLPSGKILVAGGEDFGGLVTAELFDPVTQLWSLPINMGAIRLGHAAVLLPSGRVLLAGGYNTNGYLTSSEYYDEEFPVGGHWSAAGSLPAPRRSPSLTLMPNGKVLLAGGSDVALATLTFDPATNNWSGSGALAQARRAHTATLLGSGKVLVAGGFVTVDTVTNYVQSAELYDAASDTWSSAGTLTTARAFHTATLLPSGKVLVMSGNNDAPLNSCELYDPATNQWSAAAPVSGNALTGRTATLLPNGKVFLFGGNDGTTYQNDAVLYDPVRDAWTFLSDSASAATNHTATLLPSGQVLMVGGGFKDVANKIAQIYDPPTDTWLQSGLSQAVARYAHTATLLASGKVLVAAGHSTADLASAEVFDSNYISDPDVGLWHTTGALNQTRSEHRAVRLPSGRVLVAGGASVTAESYDPGLGIADATRPLLSPLPATILLPGALQLGGSGFHASTQAPAGAVIGSEASGGGTSSNAASNVPIVLLQRIDNEQQVSPGLDPAQPWTDTALATARLEPFDAYHQRGIIDGPYRISVVVNAVPSMERVVILKNDRILAGDFEVP
jgi:N-acetylneuraminic acid mutarotase